MTEENAICTRIIAEVYAAFYPIGESRWGTEAPPNAYFARKDFHGSGIEVRSGVTSGAARVAFMRTLKGMAVAGTLTLSRRGRAMWPRARLSETAEAEALALCSLPSIADSFELVARLFTMDCHAGGWIGERELLGEDIEPGDRIGLVEMALPAATRGLVEVHSDCQGRIYYRPLPAAEAPDALASPPATSQTAPDDECFELYEATLCAALESLNTATPKRPGEIGMIPLSVGGIGPIRPRAEWLQAQAADPRTYSYQRFPPRPRDE